LELETFLLADAASSFEGKLYVHGGGITRLNAPTLPLILPSLALVLRLRPEREDFGVTHQMNVTLTDPDGGVVFPPLPLPFEAPEAVETVEGEEVYFSLTLNLPMLTFARAGVYTMSIAIDDNKVRTSTLPVVAMTPDELRVALTPLNREQRRAQQKGRRRQK